MNQQTTQQKSIVTRKNLAKYGAGAVVGTALVSSPAHADVSTLFTQATTDLGGVESGVMAVLGILATVVAVLVGWAYFKRVR